MDRRMISFLVALSMALLTVGLASAEEESMEEPADLAMADYAESAETFSADDAMAEEAEAVPDTVAELIRGDDAQEEDQPVPAEETEGDKAGVPEESIREDLEKDSPKDDAAMEENAAGVPQENQEESDLKTEVLTVEALPPERPKREKNASDGRTSANVVYNNQGGIAIIQEEELRLLNCVVSGYGEYGEEPIRVYSGCPSLLVVGQEFSPVYGWSVAGTADELHTAMSIFLNGKLLWSGDQDVEMPAIILNEAGDCAVAFRVFDEAGRVAEIVDHVQVVPADAFVIDFSQLGTEIVKDKLNTGR